MSNLLFSWDWTLKSGATQIRGDVECASEALAGFGEAAIPQFLGLMEIWDCRSNAVYGLAIMGPKARAAIPSLIFHYGKNNSSNWQIRDAIKKIGVADRALQEQLLGWALEANEDKYLRNRATDAADILANEKSLPAEFAPKIIKAALDSNVRPNWQISQILVPIRTREAIDFLINETNIEANKYGPLCNISSCYSLWVNDFYREIGNIAIPALIDSLNKNNLSIYQRINLIIAMQLIDDQEAYSAAKRYADALLPSLLADIRPLANVYDWQNSKTVAATNQLMALGTLAKEAGVALLPLLDDNRPAVRKYVISALSRIRATGVRPTLIRVSEQDEDSEVRDAAKRILGYFPNE